MSFIDFLTAPMTNLSYILLSIQLLIVQATIIDKD